MDALDQVRSLDVEPGDETDVCHVEFFGQGLERFDCVFGVIDRVL